MHALTCERKLTVDKSADEVWDWLSDVRNAMTANQFHESVDWHEPVTGPGPVVPIRHNIFGRRNVRLGRITQYKKYHVAWGEQLVDEYGPDTFPHSVALRVVPVDDGRCTIYTRVRGVWNYPVAKLIGPYVWNLFMPPVLDADLQDVALAVGAIREKKELQLPPEVPALLRLMNARTVDSVPAEELVASVRP
jgi:hypothetical protein